jgi:thioredoxin-dependent peroxiredoxin
MPIELGKAPPPLALQDAEGNEVSLADFAGKKVIVYFYPRDNTSGCTKEACAFRDLHSEIQEQDAVVLGVSPDKGATHAKFADKYELQFLLPYGSTKPLFVDKRQQSV